MGSLSSSLSIATSSLMAEELQLSVANNNIANANTVGYSREIVNLQQAAPTSSGGLDIGNGVDVQGIQSVQDQLLTSRIQQQTSNQSSATAQANALSQIETLFPTSGTGLSTALSTFFSGLSSLSADPTNASNRATVISDAQTLVEQFHSVSEGLSGPTSGLNTTVQTDVAQINQLTSQAAQLNQQITAQSGGGQPPTALTAELAQIETSLAQLTNISVTHGQTGDAITTGNGTPLVLGSVSYALSTTTGPTGSQQVLDSNGTNITANISGGDLGGTLQVVTNDIPGLQNAVDTLASQFATAFNAAQAQGYDLNGNQGTALFSVPTTVAGSASAITLTTTNPNAIAASSDGTAGSNGNVANLTALQNSTLPSGSSVTAQASSLIYQVGNLSANANAQVTSIGTSLTSLSNLQSSVSGVSIDEESANLLRYQQAYQASARVIETIDTLFQTTLTAFSNG
jgi:flagellar hook-associated protein 1 FlgK